MKMVMNVNKIKYNIARFMQGRYGYDQFNNFIILLSLFFAFLNMFIHHDIMVVISYCLLFYAVFRMLSKNIWDRQKEYFAFLDYTKGIRQHGNVFKRNLKDKEYKYFLCPNCKQMVRVPRGKGNIEIKCPKCQHKFDRKS